VRPERGSGHLARSVADAVPAPAQRTATV